MRLVDRAATSSHCRENRVVDYLFPIQIRTSNTRAKTYPVVRRLKRALFGAKCSTPVRRKSTLLCEEDSQRRPLNFAEARTHKAAPRRGRRNPVDDPAGESLAVGSGGTKGGW